MELLRSNIKKNSGNRNPKRASYISANGTFQSTPRKFLIFQETETPKKFLIFQETELSYISGKVYSEPSHIFRTRNIFRTLAYLQLEAYSEPFYI